MSTHGEKESHGESHASMSGGKSRRKSRVDTSAEFPQVRKSRGSEEKVTRPLPRKVTFSALSLRRAERDPRGGGDQQNPPPTDGPEPVGALAEKFLHRLAAQGTDEERAARRAEALNRLRRPLTNRTKEQQP